MAIVNCKFNHFYDDRKHLFCPFCASDNKTSLFTEEMTVGGVIADNIPPDFVFFADESPTLAFADETGCGDNEEDRTIGILRLETDSNPVVGWLVCISGIVKGKSYELHMGRNFFGRKKEMDIVLSDDNLISRKRHFSLVYDPKSNCYYVAPEEGFIYLNEKAVREPAVLADGDQLTVGDTQYIFVAYCNEKRRWL